MPTQIVDFFVAEKNNLYGYVNAKGDTVVACKYLCSYTDTIVRIGFVGDNSGKIRCIDNKGNMLFYVFNFDNGPDYPSEAILGLWTVTSFLALLTYEATLL